MFYSSILRSSHSSAWNIPYVQQDIQEVPAIMNNRYDIAGLTLNQFRSHFSARGHISKCCIVASHRRLPMKRFINYTVAHPNPSMVIWQLLMRAQHRSGSINMAQKSHNEQVESTVARLTPEQKAACAKHVGVKHVLKQFYNNKR
jgi:hypothetical protein